MLKAQVVISLVDGTDPRADDLVIIAGVHTGFLQLITAHDIAGVGDLRSQKVAVDTDTDTGYASALFDILRTSGLQRDVDYEVVDAGATDARYRKLLDGDFEATLLGAPFTDLALARGFHSQGSVREELNGYQGVVLVAKQSWLAGHEEAARRVAASLVGAEQWAMAPANRDEAAAVVKQSVPGLADGAEAQAVTDTLFGPASEYQPDGRLSPEGISVVVDLYNASRGRNRTVASVMDLIDYRYLPTRRQVETGPRNTVPTPAWFGQASSPTGDLVARRPRSSMSSSRTSRAAVNGSEPRRRSARSRPALQLFVLA